MTDQPARPAMTMRDIRTALGHSEPPVLVEATRYEVSVLPFDDINRGSFTISVEARGEGRWAVSRHRQCLDANGNWSWESIPSERTDDWLAQHRFDLDTALSLARKAAPHLVVNGHTALDAYHRTHA
ncbi:hypothetical protein ABZ135_18540 [Streptomyces sp. NPDC006339]|uniref:hypothetical protein n=1 Tax=Streptomyces sp. NPDC006339 TaxID=3156755 RepID=UPI0033AF0978